MIRAMPDSTGSMNDAYVRAVLAEMAPKEVTQVDLAEAVGVNKATVNTYLTRNLTNRVKMTVDILEAMAERMGMTFEELTAEAVRRRAKR